MKTIVALFSMMLVSTSVFASDDVDCKPSRRLRNMEMECVSCGIQKATGGQLVPSDRWIALLALSTARMYPSSVDFTDRKQSPGQSDLHKQIMYRHMAEKIQTYGVCLDRDLNPSTGAPLSGPAYTNLEAADMGGDWIGEVTGSYQASGSEVKATLRRVFGVKDESAMRDFFYVDNWAHLSLDQRRAIAQARIDRAARGHSPVNGGDVMGDQLQKCMKHSSLLNRNHGHFRIDQKGFRDNNIAVCRGIAESCGLPDALFCAGGTPPRPAAQPGAKGGSGGGAPPPASLFTAPTDGGK